MSNYDFVCPPQCALLARLLLRCRREGLSLHSWNVKGALLHRTVFPVPSAGAVPFMRIVEESKTGPVVAVVAGASVALVSVSNTEHVQAWAFTAPYSSVIDVVSGAVKGEPVVFIVSGEGSAESMDVFASITVQSVRASGELVSTSVNRSPALASSVSSASTFHFYCLVLIMIVLQVVCVATVKDGTVDVLFLSPVGDSIVVYSPFSNVPTPHLLSSFLMGEAAQRRGVGLKLAAPNVLPGDKQPHHAPIVLSLMQGGDVLIGFSPNSKMASIDVGSSGETRLGECNRSTHVMCDRSTLAVCLYSCVCVCVYVCIHVCVRVRIALGSQLFLCDYFLLCCLSVCSEHISGPVPNRGPL